MKQVVRENAVLRKMRVFVICAVLCGLIAAAIFAVAVRHERTMAELSVEETRIFMQTVLEREIYITDIMKTWVHTLGEENMRNMQADMDEESIYPMFEEMAVHFYQDEFVRALELQPDGVNRYVYPREGNEKAIGQDVFHLSNSEQRKADAEKSRETGAQMVTGPLSLDEGGEALLVRNPIYYKDGTFWGFALVVLDVPGVFDSFGLSRLENDGYEYELHCAHSDSSDHIIAKYGETKLKDPVAALLQIKDKEWVLDVIPEGGWINPQMWYSAVLLILFVSIALTFISEDLRDSRQKAVDSLQKELAAENRSSVLEYEKNQLAFYDELTGCLNFQGFQLGARRIITENPEKNFGISYFDIKDFKVFNERYGYEKGDEVLKYIVRNLQDMFSEHEIVGRVHGDVFVALACYEDVSQLSEHFKYMVKRIREYMNGFAPGAELVVHVGVYLLTDEDRHQVKINKMIDNANFAQKSVKDKSSTQYVLYTGRYRDEQIRRGKITRHLPAALQNGEISVHLQPQFNYETGQIVGAEALCRWKHKDFGPISPGEFIPILEESGQITELDMFVWEEACRLMRKWDDQGKKISVSVNVSRNDIFKHKIEEYFPELVNKYGLEPERLKLEITETVYTQNSKHLMEVVAKLRQKGFIIEMDDFGTGYSSLNMLKEVPVDVLKLDMRFLSGEGDIIRGKKIVGSILQLAHAIEIPVIAEGVENEKQAEYLDGIGCALMQGYYFSGPLPVDEFEALMATQSLGAVPDNFFVLEQLESELFANNELVPVGIIKYEANSSEKLRYVSGSLLQMLGYSKKQFVQKFENRFSNIIYEGDRKRVLAEIQEQIQIGKYDYCEYRIEAANGELLWVADRGHLVKDDLGMPWFYAAIVRMEQKKYQNAFADERSYEEKTELVSDAWHQMMELMPGGAFCYDVDYNQEFQFISGSMPELFGYSMEEFRNKFKNRFPDMVYAEDRQRVLDEIDTQIQGCNNDYCEYRVETADGSLKWVYDRGRVVRDANGKRWFYVVILDADEFKAAEKRRMEYWYKKKI